MLVLLTAVFLLRRFAPRAVPLPAATYAEFETPTVVDHDPSKGYHGWDVFVSPWICIFTALACTWIAVHPNVPARKRRRTLFPRGSRAFLMILSIISPGFMIVWALIQWRAAVMIRDVVNKAIKEASPDPEKPFVGLWSTRHGHFVQMGGLYSISSKRKIDICEGVSPEICDLSTESQTAASNNRSTDIVWEGVITVGALKRLIAKRNIPLPIITEDDIRVRSKDCAVPHIVALLLLTCFVVQIVAHAVQGSAMTELELITATLVGLNSITYIFWWSKPYDVRRPVVFESVEEHSAKGTMDTTSSSLDQEFDVEKHVPTTIASSIEGRLEDGRGTGPNIPNENSARTKAESALFSNV